MFDLIGYWAAVTFFVGMVLIWVLPLSVYIIDWLISLITQGDYKSFIKDKYGNFNMWSLLCRVYTSDVLPALLFVGAVIGNASIFVVTMECGTILIESVNLIALKTTPIFSYLAIITLAWFTFLFIGRFIYSLFKDIKALKAKVATQELNKDE